MIDSNQVPFDEMRLQKLLTQYWGYGEFRPHQIGPIKAFVGGSDTLAVMPTGGGKSLCYQITGLYHGGVCSQKSSTASTQEVKQSAEIETHDAVL